MQYNANKHILSRAENKQQKKEQKHTHKKNLARRSQITPYKEDADCGSVIHAVALPLQRDIAIFWKNWRVDSAGGMLSHWPRRRPMQIMSEAVTLKPPRVSKARGMKEMPIAWQAESWVANFLSSAASRVWPLFSTAPRTVDCCRIKIMVTSKAAGQPLFQQGR